MNSRTARVTVLLLLLAAGTGAAAFLREADQRITLLEDTRDNVDAALETMMAAAAELSRTQLEYVAAGRADEQALGRVSALLQDIARDGDSVKRLAQSADAPAQLQEVDAAVTALVQADHRIREHVALEQLSTAADLVAGDARDAADDLRDRLEQLRAAERAAAASERAGLERQQLLALGGAAGLWLIGLIMLVPRTGTRASSNADVSTVSPVPAPEPVAAPPSLDLTEAAAVCAAMAQVTSTDALPALLGRAAAVLEATGVVVWMGAGEDLFAVTAHGYDSRVLGRLGPIRRGADNATAAAWRSGERRIVAADTVSNGAIVAPMIGPSGCIGVLAAEVRRGRESDPAVQATTTIIASQLATALAAWPQASTEPATAETEETATASG